MNFNINNIQRTFRARTPKVLRTSAILRHGPRLVEVVARPETELALSFQPGDKIKVDVGGAMRSYTPSRLDANELRFIGVVHGGGPGSSWLAALREGDPVRFFGPAPSLPPADSAVAWAAFAGDETTLGAARALLDALPAHVHRFGALEVDPDSVNAVEALALPVATLARRTRGAELLRWAEHVPIPNGEGIVWLSGEASSLVPLKRTLLARGFERRALRIKSYWSVKGNAHRKALEQGALR